MYLQIILSILFLTTSAFASGTYDASGEEGRDGSNGSSGYSGDGSNGSSGTNGENGGSITAEVGFVSADQTQIYVRGTLRPANGRVRNINDVIATENFSGLLFRANGGKGGDGGAGGEGGDGRDGSDGRSGSSFGFDLDGGDGSDGSNGHDGGNGGDGADGGNAGSVQVTIAPDSKLIAHMISVEADPGRRGDAGRAGREGDGGDGGSGGSGACDWADTSMDPLKNYKLGKCGSRGRSGSDGRDGSPGRSGSAGRDGARGVATLTYTNGAQVRGGYRMQVSRAEIAETIPDGVFEPGEKVEVRSLTFRNIGDGVLPATSLNVTFANGERVTQSTGDVPPGGSVAYSLPRPVVLDSHTMATARSLSLRLNYLHAELVNGAAISLNEPINLGGVNSPVITSGNGTSVLTIKLSNLSKVSYGQNGDIKRRVQVVVSVPQGSLLTLGAGVEVETQKVIEVPAIAARSDITLTVPVSIRKGAKLGQDYGLSIALKLQKGSALAEIDSASTEIAYTLETSRAFQFSQSVVGLRVFCRYPQAINSERIISKIWINKAAHSNEVQFVYDLKYSFSKSYVYKTTINNLGGALNTIVTNGTLTQEEVTAIMNNTVAPLTRYTENHKASWELSSCFVQ